MASFSIPEFLTYERSLIIFLFASVLLGGGAAWLAGRAIALAWRPWWHVLPYMLILGVAVRFLHFAVFASVFLSLHYYLVDTTVCVACGLLSFRLMRVRQMVTRYDWINERAGVFGWRQRARDAADASNAR
jgi:uncharacterized protein DUF6867